MGFAENYFRKQRSFKPSIHIKPRADLRFIIVIPATRETGVLFSLQSIISCNPIEQSLEIIVLINSSIDSTEDIRVLNRKTYEEVKQFDEQINDQRRRIFPILVEDMPYKDAGVGLARKSGMDEALWRFEILNKPSGYIICFDADATCDPDYLTSIENQVTKFPLTRGCSVYFEHEVDNELYPLYQRNAIISYEIHLRYYKLALRYIGFPYSFHTIGSSMLVNALCYAEQGGMNKHKAGEDFYFLQKIIPLGEFYELNNTRILLSPRESDRVPFGTGAAIGKMMDRGIFKFETYHFQSFLDLKELFSKAECFFRKDTEEINDLKGQMPGPLREYLDQNNFLDVVKELNQNSARIDTFLKRFYQWWNAFRILKYQNFAHANFYTKMDSIHAAEALLKKILPSYSALGNSRMILDTLRRIERDQEF